VQALPGSTGRVKAYSGGVVRLEHRFTSDALDVEWSTPGVNRIELVGPVQVGSIDYQFIDTSPGWQHVKHLCLPVTRDNYPCRPNATNSDADEARGRLPVAGLWATKYETVFNEMYPTLKALAGREAPPPIPSTPEGQPDGPTLELDPRVAIDLATLDPHVARMLGIAWDDPLPNGLDDLIYGYKVVGRWWRQPVKGKTTNLNPESLQAEHGITWEQAGATVEVVGGRLRVRLPGGAAVLRFKFAEAMDLITLDMPRRTAARWRASGEDGAEVGSGQVPFSLFSFVQPSVRIRASALRKLEFIGPAEFEIHSVAWTTVSWIARAGFIPGIRARELGPPLGPTWITAGVRQPVGTAAPIEAALDWEIQLSETNVYKSDGSVFYQLAAVQISTNPAAPPPTVPAFSASYLLLDRDWIVVPPPIAASFPPRELHIDLGTDDAGLAEGWRCWWARGVDLFGRVSTPSPPVVRKVEDTALPPPPILLFGEYAQADLAARQGMAGVQSSLAREWLTTNPTANAFAMAWAWTPELHEQCPDVDGFRIFSRRAVAVSNPAPGEPSITYESVPWGSSIASFGPIPVRFEGQITRVTDGIAGPITVSLVAEVTTGQWRCTSTLALHVGGGAFAGATLIGSSSLWTIVGHGEGTTVELFVTGSSAPAVAGGYSISKGASDVVEVATNMSVPADPGPMQRRIAGALVLGERRLLVLHAKDGHFVCRTGDPSVGSAQLPASGTASWYPAYAFAIAASGSGPQPSLANPVAYGQITVRSVRRWASRPLESPPAQPASIHAIDLTEPATPPSPAVASGDYCAELATRADWYGASRFTLTWTPDPGLTYMVYRALGDAVIRLDLEAHTSPPATPSGARQARAHAFVQTNWIAEIWNDAGKRQLVQNDLAALDAALAIAVPLPDTDPTRRSQIGAAYAELHADTQRILAYQPYARRAFVAMFGKPIDATQVPYVDTIEGRSRARWFYRIASRTPAGLESEWTPPTPPICCPDVVPPSPPQVISAFAAVGKVRLRWLASPEPDVIVYRLYRTRAQGNSADIRLMEAGEVIAASPMTATRPGVDLPTPVLEGNPPTARQGWLQFDAAAVPAGTWYFRLVAEDVGGNWARPSNVLRGTSLPQPLAPPIWVSAVRAPIGTPDHVALVWSHPNDQRLSCLVERRPSGLAAWLPASEWLPRGTYSYADRSPDLRAAAEYRLRIRDRAGQTATVMPSITVPAVP
jgi:hypothetical protein